MNQQKTLYAKIVALKKRFIQKRIVPERIASIIDGFFNTLHNLRIQSQDKTRDMLIKSRDITRDTLYRSRDIARDTLIKSRDVTKDALHKSTDLTRDTLIKSKDLTRDALIKSRDVTKDALHKSTDLTRDTLIKSKDVTRDALIKSRDVTKDVLIRSGDTLTDRLPVPTGIAKDALYITRMQRLRYGFLYPFTLLYNISTLIWTSIQLIPYAITEESDQATVKNIQKIVVNSNNVKDRVTTYYKRASVVVYPPIETKQFVHKDHGTYWLSVNRLTPEKRVDIQIAAFKKMPTEQLIIVGGYDDSHAIFVEELKKTCPDNVTFAGEISNNELVSLYANCIGLITTSINEDFGMNAVEALASGKPVIAPNEGGYKETLVDGQTGIVLSELTEDAIVGAVQHIQEALAENPEIYRETCIQQASKFDTGHFVEQIKEAIHKDMYLDPDRQLVFIVGAPRSGTTWLWGLLTSHEDVEPLLMADFTQTGRSIRADGKYESVETNMLFDRTFDEIKQVLAKKTKKVLVEKTPDHLLQLKKIREQFPSAKIVHILRNPLSVYASYKYSDWNKKVGTVAEWVPIYLRRINVFLQYRNDPHLLTISYEDLSRKPKQTLRKVFDFVDLSTDSIARIIKENKGVSKSVGKHSIRKAMINSWYKELDQREVSLICERLKHITVFRHYLNVPLRYKLAEYTQSFLQSLSQVEQRFAEKNLVFIVGIPRSGTTWLWRLLSHQQDVSILTAYDFKKTNPGEFFEETDMLFNFSIETIKRVIATKDKKTIVEKTPMHITQCDLIAKEFPNAKIIHVTRNPFSVYASYKFTEFGGWEYKNISVVDWVNVYKELFASFANKLDNPNIYTIRYEDLLEDTKGTLTKVLSFLDIDPVNIDIAITSNTFEKNFPDIHKIRSVNSLTDKLTEHEHNYIQNNLRDEIAFLEKIR